MHKMIRRSLAAILALVLCLGLTAGAGFEAQAAGKTPTVANWGIRGQTATSLSNAGQRFYSGSYSFENLITHAGSKYQNEVPNSDLYKTLQQLMASRHTYQTNYDELRYNVYNYTDCENGDTGSISCFYSGKDIGPKWDSGATWNREHTWPQSKGSGKNTPAGADIMAVRPTASSANGSRGNTAYGESNGFYHPNTGTNFDLRGDCARIVLYTYVRWGTPVHLSNMWGKGGVIENQNILLKWMQEDPVDTWELGRNDSIESFTGTRNVFVDYPELAFLLFGREVPTDMVTPSGEASLGVSGGSQGGTTTPPQQCTHRNTDLRNEKEPTCTMAGYTGDTYCRDCGTKLEAGKSLPAAHKLEMVEATQATCSQPGNIAHYVCTGCGNLYADEGAGKILGQTEVEILAPHDLVQVPQQDSTCTAPGLLGHYSCNACKLLFADENAQKKLTEGELVIPAGHKTEFVSALAPTVEAEGHIAHYRCSLCSKRFSDEAGTDRLLENQIRIAKLEKPQVPEDDSGTMMLLAGGLAIVLVAGIGAAVVIVKQKNKAEP